MSLSISLASLAIAEEMRARVAARWEQQFKNAIGCAAERGRFATCFRLALEPRDGSTQTLADSKGDRNDQRALNKSSEETCILQKQCATC